MAFKKYPLLKLLSLEPNVAQNVAKKDYLVQQPQPNCNPITKANLVVRKRTLMRRHNRTLQAMNIRTRFP